MVIEDEGDEGANGSSSGDRQGGDRHNGDRPNGMISPPTVGAPWQLPGCHLP
jgi:hypothetical protein